MSILKPLISKKLAVGPSHNYGGPSLNDLKEEGITAIVDLNQDSEEMRDAKRVSLKYCVDPKLRIEDNYEPVPTDILEYITSLIDALISQGHYVYVHCSASRGRSPTIAAAYLIRLGKSKIQSMNLVKTIRPMAWSGRDSNYPAFLEEFEKRHRERKQLV